MIFDRFRREKGITGLDETRNNAKMTALIAGPFCVAWLVIQMFVPLKYMDMVIIIMFFGWIGYIVFYYAWAKADASSYRPFPQIPWRFPDGSVRVFSMLIPPDGYERLKDYEKGEVGYHVSFTEKYEHHDPKLPFPDIFEDAYWLLPRSWEETFDFRSAGEFFHKGVIVDHPACEYASVYVLDWELKEGKRTPVCAVNDCALRYAESVKGFDGSPLSLTRAKILETLLVASRKRELRLQQHSAYLEETLDIVMKEGSQDVKKIVNDRMRAIRDRVHTIMDTGESRLSRIFNFKNVAKALLILGLLFLITHFVIGWP